jgi:predicted nucleic acid-binding protein
VKLFLDANILFTAARTPAGKAAFVIACGGEGYWQLITSAYAVEEARRNLERKTPTALPQLAELLGKLTIVIPSPAAPCPDGLPLKDRPIFQAAHTGSASHLLTGDLKDFGLLMNRPDLTFGIIIQTVAEFLTTI